jgi:hypothetical protein
LSTYHNSSRIAKISVNLKYRGSVVIEKIALH